MFVTFGEVVEVEQQAIFYPLAGERRVGVAMVPQSHSRRGYRRGSENLKKMKCTEMKDSLAHCQMALVFF